MSDTTILSKAQMPISSSLHVKEPQLSSTTRLKNTLKQLCSCFRTRNRIAPEEKKLLPHTNALRKTLILDLDETLIHSSIKPIPNYDMKLSIEIDYGRVEFYVAIRPWAEEFIKKVSKLYEVVIFTASLKAYADPVIDLIDQSKVIKNRLFRDDCGFLNGNYIKNLNKLGRDLKKVVIVDNSPSSYALHPNNALEITTWYSDKSDSKLIEIYGILKALHKTEDIPKVLKLMNIEKLEMSTTNVNAVVDTFEKNRSFFNSPLPAEEIQLKLDGDLEI